MTRVGMCKVQTHFPGPISWVLGAGPGRPGVVLWTGMILRKALGTTEAEVERGNGVLGMELHNLLTAWLGTPIGLILHDLLGSWGKEVLVHLF